MARKKIKSAKGIKTKKIVTTKTKKRKKIFKDKVEMVLDEAKKGELNVGKSDKKVESKKQAIAIALASAAKAVKRGSIKKTKKKRRRK